VFDSPATVTRVADFALVPAVYVLLLRAAPTGADQVLLHRRIGTGYYDDHWTLVAGHTEPGESVLETAVREAAEEVGVDIDIDDLQPLTTVHRTRRGGGPIEQRADFFFATRRWRGEPSVREPAKNGGLRWAPLDDLPLPLVPVEVEVMTRLYRDDLPPVLVHGF
jgi:8-oxo-dGTP pyrophosphatase MutT (NUDIX family)